MIAGVAIVKDEADVIVEAVDHALGQLDFVIVADNGSTDGTHELLSGHAEHGRRLHLRADPEVGYYQSRKMSALAHEAGAMGAEWVVPFDADEFWVTADRERPVKEALAEQPADVVVATAELYNHVTTDQDRRRDPTTERMRWRIAEAGALPKVAVRARPSVTILQGNHGAEYSDASAGDRRADGLLTIHHYPYRSVEQVIRKVRNGAAAYAAAPDLPEDYGDHWRKYGQMSDAKLGAMFRQWWFFIAPDQNPNLEYDPLVKEAVYAPGPADRR